MAQFLPKATPLGIDALREDLLPEIYQEPFCCLAFGEGFNGRGEHRPLAIEKVDRYWSASREGIPKALATQLNVL